MAFHAVLPQAPKRGPTNVVAISSHRKRGSRPQVVRAKPNSNKPAQEFVGKHTVHLANIQREAENKVTTIKQKSSRGFLSRLANHIVELTPGRSKAKASSIRRDQEPVLFSVRKRDAATPMRKVGELISPALSQQEMAHYIKYPPAQSSRAGSRRASAENTLVLSNNNGSDTLASAC